VPHPCCSRFPCPSRWRKCEALALTPATNREDHHPDLRASHNRFVVAWSTHDAGGVTQNAIICAAKSEQLQRR
jgi:pterin-4a-carbinolamine dehydratase